MKQKRIYKYGSVCALVIFLMIKLVNAEKYNKETLEKIRNHKLIIIDPVEEQILRQLDIVNNATLTPQGFKIKAQFPSGIVITSQIKLVKRLFQIAAQYFQKTIYITKILNQIDSKYPISQTQFICGFEVPNQYREKGFNVKQIDSVAFIIIQDSPTQAYVAYAYPCALLQWPIYGAIGFNLPQINKDLTKMGLFHDAVLATIHQIIHLLAFSQKYFIKPSFFVSYNNPMRKQKDQIFKSVMINGTMRSMVITPGVKLYIQTYFNCKDQNIGALLEDDGIIGEIAVHWERKVFYNQIMTPSLWPSGLIITPLTLHLMQDTGFFYQIDMSLSQRPTFGKRAGCDFAKGIATAQSNPNEYCNEGLDQSLTCGYSALYGGKCSSRSKFGDGTSVIAAARNLVCSMPQFASTLTNPQLIYSSQSRCFVNANKVGISCYTFQCLSQSIIIQVGGTKIVCKEGQGTVKIGQIQLKCPQNKQIFCSREICQDWCSNEGVCVNGNCVYLECKKGQYLKNGQCLKCKRPCLYCLNQNRCLWCTVGFTQVFGKCIKCSQRCFSCSSVNKCILCRKNFKRSDNGYCPI